MSWMSTRKQPTTCLQSQRCILFLHSLSLSLPTPSNLPNPQLCNLRNLPCSSPPRSREFFSIFAPTMGNGFAKLTPCIAGDGLCHVAIAVTSELPGDESLGHSFCYVRPDLPLGCSGSSKVHHSGETTTFRSISGAVVSANPSTPLSTTLLLLPPSLPASPPPPSRAPPLSRPFPSSLSPASPGHSPVPSPLIVDSFPSTFAEVTGFSSKNESRTVFGLCLSVGSNSNSLLLLMQRNVASALFSCI